MTATTVLYACGAALLYALCPSFYKIAVKRTAPSLSAALFATVVFVLFLASSILGNTARSVLSVDNTTFIRLIGAGAIHGIIWLCLFAALSVGQVNRVMPLYLMTDVILDVLSFVTAKKYPGIWHLCCIVLVLLGVVMAESRSTRSKNSRWLWFSLLALAANIGLRYYRDAFLSSASTGIIRLGETGSATVLLWLLTALGKSYTSFKKMETENWLFLVLAGLSAALTVFFEMQVSAINDVSVLNPLRCALLPLTVLLSRFIHREKMPGNAVVGVTFFAAGTFGLMLNL